MRKVFVLFVLLWVGFSLSAQDAAKFTGSLLWKISGKDLREPSYIFATHHLAPVHFLESVVGLEDALASADQLVGELIMVDQPLIQAKLQMAAMMPAGESYKKLLSKEDYSELDKEIKATLGVGLDQMGMFKPGMLSTLYTLQLYAHTEPDYSFATHEAIDTYLQKKAKKDGKLLLGLETAEEQIHALFDASPLKGQAENLLCVARHKEHAIEAIKVLSKNYYEARLGLIFVNAYNPETSCPVDEVYQRAINEDRNNKWLAKLPGIMKSGPSFIAVGALHLPGEIGLLYQLEKMGYQVEPVR
ncbi:TraB/GumN family protein [Odoribacter sp. OttesenSCG-928-J03]|nr:TraB/GumN family protein [Odoribacter sp. OttesenSCG-928-J03]MDL2283136.1 TraB/GumN family protein [Odoribacter sp. OttesenSCG-928-G04]MDL2330492.1 TraB/GumN family protein [Odoribacter sp. OttesenSCG-928-A06]